MPISRPSIRRLFDTAWIVGALCFCMVVMLGLLMRPAPSDLIVVLGNEILISGKPSLPLQARLDCAVSLYQRQMAPTILVSGGIGKSGYDEAQVMAAYLEQHGVPKHAIIIDSIGVNTMATARNTFALLQNRQLQSVIMVSQYFHLPRCLLAFRMAGINSLSADYPRFMEWRDIPSTLREIVALPVYALRYSSFHL
jgi:vancomycin permeability regulator SanA